MLFTTFFNKTLREADRIFFAVFTMNSLIVVVQDQNKLWQPVDKTLKTLAIELAEFQVDCFFF